ILSPAPRAPVLVGHLSPGSRTHRGIAFSPPLRGLRSLLVIFPPVRGLTGGYILSPAPRLRSLLIIPPFRGLTGGYILSPAPRAPVLVGHLSPGSRTHRGIHSLARSAGSGLC